MESMYVGKKVLSIGARERVLTALSEELKRHGFSAVWTNRYDDVPFLTGQFHAGDFDIIAFGRGVSADNKQRLKQVYKEQNPDIRFVDGLAPITNLLVDQVKLACLPDHYTPINMEMDNDSGIVVESQADCRLTIKHYTLNRLFQSKEKVAADQHIDKGSYRFPVKTSRGRNFLVAVQDGIVTKIMSL